VPIALERQVQEMVRTQPAGSTARQGRQTWATLPIGTAALSALATALAFLVVLFLVPLVSGGQRSLAHMVDVLLGQTRIIVTPTLQVGSTLTSQALSARLTPEVGATPEDPSEDRGLPHREPLRDLVAAELLIGRAPSTPRALPQEYALQEIAAVSYPNLPSWISQPFYVELCYGPKEEGASSALWLRQYRLLFRELGGISGVQVASDAVKDMEQVDVKGATGMLLTLDVQGDGLSYTVLWERDGLLLELETDSLSQQQLLEIARSVR
jgi:hypothetical protein